MQVRCVHCQVPMEVADDSDFNQLTCASCGATFSLMGEATSPYLTGGRVLGRFELIEQVGAGTFGTVWKARDSELRRFVAIKVPRRDRLGPNETEHFLREARAAAQLRHPHVVSVHEVGRDGDTVYIVSDFIQGVTLDAWLAVHAVTPREAAALCATVADALHHAHELGVVHRDVKLANIMLTQHQRGSGSSTDSTVTTLRHEVAAPARPAATTADWVPMLMDFGLARRNVDEATLTVVGRIMGTPSFMSPEQARGQGHTADRRTDLYSLGVVLFRLLSGELPFRGTTEMLAVQIIGEEPPSPRRLNHRVPRDLEVICLKCLEKEPARRYQTALEVAEDLQRFLKGEPILARPVGRVERWSRWARRQPAQAALILVSFLAALGLVGAAVGGFYHLRLVDAHELTQAALVGESLARGRAETAQRDETRHRRRAELYQYFHHIALAHAEWRDGSVGRVQPLLNECAPNNRNWEWRYLDRLCHAELLTLQGHDKWVYNVWYSPDGTRIASAGADNAIRIWNASTGQLVMTLKGNVTTTSGFAFSPDGLRVVTSDEDGTIRFSNAARGDPISSLAGAKGAVMAYSPDGKLLAIDTEQHLEVWDLGSRQRVFSIPNEDGHVPAFSPDGARLLRVRSSAMDVEVWDLKNDKQPVHVLTGHVREPRNAAYSPDNRLIATCSWDQTVRLWDAATGQCLHVLRGHTNEVTCVAFSPNGQRLASAGMDQTVRVWDCATGREWLTFKGHAGGVHGVYFSPDGTRIVSGSLDRTVKVWDATFAPEALSFPGDSHDFRYVSLAFDRLAQLHWATSDGIVRAWDLGLGQEAGQYVAKAGRESVFSSDGKWCACAWTDGSVRVMKAQEGVGGGATAATVQRVQWPDGACFPLAFDKDARRLATVTEKGQIRITEVASGQEVAGVQLRPIPFDAGTRAYRQIGLSPDFTKAVTAVKGEPAQIWDLATGASLARLEEGLTEDYPGLFVFSPDGTLVAGRFNTTGLAIWDAATGKRRATLEGHYHLVMCLAFNHDGTRLASAGWDRTVKIWDTETGQETITLRGHPTAIVGLAFSADDAWLASASSDNTLKLWDARPWSPEAAAEREACGLLRFFANKPLCRADVLTYAERFPLTHPGARDKLLALGQRYHEVKDAHAYHDAAWAIVRRSFLNPLQYGFALRQAETANRLAPTESRFRTTLGVAHFRVGNYAEAAATLGDGALAEKDYPARLAFLALAQNQLGRKEQAQESLTRLRELLQKPGTAEDKEARSFLSEAESVLRGSEAK